MRLPGVPDGIVPVVIVGAGPAGAFCALELARGGAATLLLGAPRGDSAARRGGALILSPAARRALEARGLDEAVHAALAGEVLEIALELQGARARHPVPGFATVARDRLRAALLDAAVRAGATFVSGARVEARGRSGSLEVLRTSKGLVHARNVVLAIGRARAAWSPPGTGWIHAGGTLALSRRDRTAHFWSTRAGAAALLPAGDGRWELSFFLPMGVPPRLFQRGELVVQALVDLWPGLAEFVPREGRTEDTWAIGGLMPRGSRAPRGAALRIGSAATPGGLPGAGLDQALGSAAWAAADLLAPRRGGSRSSRSAPDAWARMVSTGGSPRPLAAWAARRLIRSEFLDMMDAPVRDGAEGPAQEPSRKDEET